MTGKIRIIAGQFRGKTLSVINQDTLRPTPNRVRETLFNWLMHYIHDATCLDAFAGSGALGIEAFSRGAQKVMLIENDRATFKQLNQNITSFQSNQLQCTQIDFFDYLDQTPMIFDIVFLDPPFQSQLLPTCLDKLHQSLSLKLNGLVYLESNNPLPLANSNWEIIKSAKAARLYFGLYKKQP